MTKSQMMNTQKACHNVNIIESFSAYWLHLNKYRVKNSLTLIANFKWLLCFIQTRY